TGKPLVRHPELAIPLSPHTDVVRLQPLRPGNTRIDVSVAAKLGEGYGHYALLFVALLAYPAERNFMNRLNECNNEQEAVYDLIAELQQQNKQAQVDIETVLANITDPELRQKLMNAIVTSKKQKRATNGDILAALHKEKDAAKQTTAALESAHL